MKIVSPYRPFAPYISNHLELGFDWVGALEMLQASIASVAPCPFYALTDMDADVKVPAHRYPTTEPRLMVWLIEAWHAYITSPDFDQDTVMLSPDMLLCQPIAHVFNQKFDLGLAVRTEPKFFDKRPLLNGIHFWRHSAKVELGAFFAAALDRVRLFDNALLRWGGDAEAVWQLVQPIAATDRVVKRAGLRVGVLPAVSILRSVSSPEMTHAARGTRMTRPEIPVMDFRYRRKASMPAVFKALRWPSQGAA